MSKWEMVRLENVCDILDSQRIPITASDRKKGNIPYYGANGVQDYVADYIFDDELVLLAEDGGNFGSKDKPIAYRVSGKCWVNNHAHVLKAKDGLDTDYLCYSIMFYDVSKLINGTTRAKLNQAAVRKMGIPYPPLEIQKQISATLGSATEHINLRKQRLAELDNLIKSVFYDMFGDPLTNNRSWAIKLLGDICNLKAGKFVSASEIKSNYDEGFYPCYGGNGLRGYVCEYSHEGNFPLIGRQGALCGNVQYAHGQFYATEHAVVTRPVIDINTRWLYFTLKELNLNRFAVGAAQPGLTVEKLNNVKIALPPTREQIRFANIVEKTEKQKNKVKKSIEESQLLFDSLMSRYFE